MYGFEDSTHESRSASRVFLQSIRSKGSGSARVGAVLAYSGYLIRLNLSVFEEAAKGGWKGRGAIRGEVKREKDLNRKNYHKGSLCQHRATILRV
jgi:hypothetical protein